MTRTTTTRGERFRLAVEGEFDNLDDPTVVALLDQLAHLLDECESMEAKIAEDGVVIEGARGQRREHPLLGALVKHRALFARLAGDLFPDERVESTTAKARRAAHVRWSRAKGHV